MPTRRTFWLQDPPSRDRPLYRMPPIALFATSIAAVPVGIARHALDELTALALDKTPSMAQAVLADRPSTRFDLGRAQATIAAAWCYLVDAVESVWARVVVGHVPTVDDRGQLWLASTHAAQTALEAVDLLDAAGGSTAVYATSPIDRCLRDARTAVQHVVTQRTNYELAGALRLGRLAAPNLWLLDLPAHAA